MNDQLWRLLNIHQQRQDAYFRRLDQANTWRARGLGTAERREGAAGANETWYRDVRGSPQRGTGGGGNQTSTATGAVATTSRARRRAPRARTRVVMAVLMGTRMDISVLRASPRPVVIWTEARCP